jgi:hypothetical protein
MVDVVEGSARTLPMFRTNVGREIASAVLEAIRETLFHRLASEFHFSHCLVLFSCVESASDVAP